MRVDYNVLTNRLTKKERQTKKVAAQKVASCLAALWNNFCLMKNVPSVVHCKSFQSMLKTIFYLNLRFSKYSFLLS